MRLTFIDIAKFGGIFLVIIGHLPTTANIHTYIYSFHMPLFFILSVYRTIKIQGVSALQCFKMFFREIVNERRDHDNLLPMTIGLRNNKLKNQLLF